MQPQQTPTNNPYDFITAPQTPAKKPLLGGNKQGKLFLGVGVLAAVTILLMIGALLFGGSSNEDTYWKAIQQQAEISRIAEIGVKSARNTEARNLAATARQTMASQQADLYTLATGAGIKKIEPKQVVLGKNTKTDEQLTKADQINRFDETFIDIMTTQLTDYQATLSSLYKASNSPQNKQTLDTMFTQVQTLVKSQTPTSGSSEETPATN